MSGLPVVTPRRLIRALERAGFFVHHVRGSHHYLRHPDRAVLISVPYHNKDLKRGTLRAILRHSGITAEELQQFL